MDPLTSSSISNTLPPVKTLQLKKSLTGVTTNEELNQLLDNTTIKRGCCMRRNKGDKVFVKVKIPRPVNYPIEVVGSVEHRFNYIEKVAEIDPKLCDTQFSDYQPGSKPCDDFYQSYCDNLREDYESMNQQKFDPTDWTAYAPECACFGQKAENTAQGSLLGLNIPPKCYMPNCGDPTSYLDKVSRDGECEMTICNALFNADELAAGQNLSIQNKVEQNCGQYKGIPSDRTPISDTGPKTEPKTDQSTSTSNNTGLYIGLGVGGFAIGLVIAVLVYKLLQKK